MTQISNRHFAKPFSHFHESHKAETDRDCNDKTSPDLFFCHDCKAQHGLHFCLSATGPLQQADSPQEISLKSMWLSRFSSKAWNKPAKKIKSKYKHSVFTVFKDLCSSLTSCVKPKLPCELTSGNNGLIHRIMCLTPQKPYMVNSVLPSLSEAWMGGETSGTNVSKSKRPVLDWAFSSQYRFSKSIMSDSSTAG